MIFCGLDLSTQSLKSTFLQNDEVINTKTVQFTSIQPEILIIKGLEVSQPISLFLKAISMLFDSLKEEDFPLNQIVSLSISAQQHGSVFLTQEIDSVLQKLDPTLGLCDQMNYCFASENSIIWMDSSTSQQKKILETHFQIKKLTGNPPFERFTANQILKIVQNCPQIYQNSKYVTLISNFFTSLLLGKMVPMDYADATGTNLMDIHSKKFIPEIVNFIDPGLTDKLIGQPVHPQHHFGKISPYFQQKYGMTCDVISGSGDNINAYAYLCDQGSILVSLGSSDVVMSPIADIGKSLGCVMPHPFEQGQFFNMLVYKNGGLVREEFLQKTVTQWQNFDQLEFFPEQVGIYYAVPEILPDTKGKTGFFSLKNGICQQIEKIENNDLRNLIESRFFMIKLHLTKQEVTFKKLMVTGGGSQNTAILQIMADILDTEIWVIDQQDATCLGAAKRAAMAKNHKLPHPISQGPIGPKEPQKYQQKYEKFLQLYDKIIKQY